MASERSTDALLFPGQGSQTADMRELVERHRPELLDLALDKIGADPFERVEGGTEFAQPAIYCASLAAWSAAGSPLARFVAGHSLGELTALAAAGSLDARDGLHLVIRRGELMAEAAARIPGGGMLAFLGEAEATRSIAAEHGLTVANDNSPQQLVLSGPGDALDAASELAKERGLRVIRLRVQGAFHSPAMAEAAAAFGAELEAIDLAPPTMPVFSSTTASVFERVREQLGEALTRPVRWRETLLNLRRAGVTRYVETGPGKVLTGLVRRTLGDDEAVEAETLAPLEAVGG